MLLVSYHMKSRNTFCEIHGLICRKLISTTRHIDVWSCLTTFLLAEDGWFFWLVWFWLGFFWRGEEQAMLGTQPILNTAAFPIGLIKIARYGTLMQHDCIIASCTALTYLLSHTKLDNVKTFQPGGNVTVLPNGVQLTGTLVLLLPGVLGHRDDWCEHSEATSLALSSCQEGLLALWLCLCSGRLVGASLSIPGSQPATAHQCWVGSLAAIGFSPAGRREMRGEGCARLCGLAGSKRRKEKGFWIRSSWLTCGKLQVTAKLTGSK